MERAERDRRGAEVPEGDGHVATQKQVGEDNKKAYCIKSFDEREDEAKEPVCQINGHEDAIEDHKDQLSSKDDHIEAMWKSIPMIDESVTKVTGDRQKLRAELIQC